VPPRQLQRLIPDLSKHPAKLCWVFFCFESADKWALGG